MRSILSNAIVGLALATFIGSTTTVSAQSKGDASMGTWKLNLEKSKYSPGPPPKSLTVKWEPAGKGAKFTSEGVGADGKPTVTEFTADYDGKDNPFKGSPAVDTASLRRIDTNTIERTDKKAGKVVQTIKREIAKDGKSFIATVKGTNAKGEPINNVLLFEKQ